MTDLDDSVQKSITFAANRLQKRVKDELRAKFKASTAPQSPGFFNSVKVYNVPPRAELGFASYIRVGVKFMWVFEEGATITPRKKPVLVVRLPGAEKLGLPRVGTKKTLSDILARFPKNKIFMRRKGSMIIFFYRESETNVIPIYLLKDSVKMPKRLSFYAMADEEGARIPEYIDRFSNG